MKRAIKYFSFMALLISVTGIRAEESGPAFAVAFFPQRQKERRQTRWTLSQWLDTKATMAAQDRWLMAHTNKVPMDFTLGWDQSTVRQGFDIDYYLMRAGIKVHFERANQWLGGDSAPSEIQNRQASVSGQLRLFGGNVQDTNLIVRAGVEYNEIETATLPRDFYSGFSAGPELQIYFSQWLGVRADYKYLFKQETRDQDRSFNGTSWFGAAFLEVSSIRAEVGYRSQVIEFQEGSSESLEETGLFGRLRLFF